MKNLKEEKTNTKVTHDASGFTGNVLVDVQSLFKLFQVKTQKVPVLKGINTKINKGDFVIIFGPSGCGKTTLLNSILGFETPTEGEVTMMGEKIYQMDEDERAILRKHNLGIIYQQPNWIKSISVIENVAFPLMLLGSKKLDALNEAAKSLEKVGMTRWSRYKPTELSAGQQQKIALARALVTDPKVLVADEPTGNLDHASSVALMQTLEDLNKSGITVIMVTHNVEQLTSANRVLQMFDGTIINDYQVTKENADEVMKQVLQIPEESQVSQANKVEMDKLMKESVEEVKKRMAIFQNTGRSIGQFFHRTGKLLIFIPMVLSYLFEMLIHKIVVLIARRNTEYFENLLTKNRISSWFSKVLDTKRKDSISRLSIIDLTTRELIDKRSRTFITITGMSVGIGLIVFLVSIGYGVERLVISRIADLEQRRQIEAFPVVGTNQRLNDETIKKFDDFSEVERVLPQMSIVSKIVYNNSSTDVVSYGVQSDYIKKSDIHLIEGDIFDNNDLNTSKPPIVNVLSESDNAADTQTSIEDQEAESLQLISKTISEMMSEDQTAKQIVANKTLLEVLGINTEEAIGKTLNVSFVIGELETDLNKRIEVDPIRYQITGVVDYGDTPIIYLPIIELKTLGIKNYSQAKLVLDEITHIPDIKEKIKVLGYNSISIEDTINQIQSFFDIARLALAVIGMGGLLIASFGMFNTLTISLLERTREIGLMKAIGMKSDEVFDLFAAQSLTMGILGGFLGLFFGYVLGLGLTLLVSSFSLYRGAEFIQLTYIPWGFVLAVIFLSAFVGILTGYYPARRATTISAMDALRYE